MESVLVVLIAAVALLAGLAAVEIRRVVRAAAAPVGRRPRIRAERPGAEDARRRLIVDVFHCHDPRRCDAVLDPALQRAENVVLRRVIERLCLRERLAERVRPWPAA